MTASRVRHARGIDPRRLPPLPARSAVPRRPTLLGVAPEATGGPGRYALRDVPHVDNVRGGRK